MIIYETLQLWHLDRVTDLDHQAFSKSEHYTKEYINYFCFSQQGSVAIDDDNNSVVGFLLFDNTDPSYDSKEERLTIVAIGVDQEYRNLGIATTLLNIFIAHLHRDVYLHVRVSNKTAQSVYQKAGFQIISTLPDYYSAKSNLSESKTETDTSGKEDALYMKRPYV